MTRTPAVMEEELKPCPIDAGKAEADGERIEKVARALAKARSEQIGADDKWVSFSELERETARQLARAAIAAYNPNDRLSTVTDEMIQAGRAEAFNQGHRTYGDMCRAIFVAMRDAALSHKD